MSEPQDLEREKEIEKMNLLRERFVEGLAKTSDVTHSVGIYEGERLYDGEYVLPDSRQFIINRNGKTWRGGIATVFCVTDLDDGNIYALKRLNRENVLKLFDDGENVAWRMVNEGEILLSLREANHPNIVHVKDVGIDMENDTSIPVPYIVMEYLNGNSAANISFHKHDPSYAIHFLYGIASALDYIHAVHLVHGDVKPANMVINLFSPQKKFNYVAKLVDFGRARNDVYEETRYPWGSPGFMSPFVLRGHHWMAKDDNWAFAASAFRMLTGIRPFGAEGTNPEAIAKRVLDPDNLLSFVGMPSMIQRYGLERCKRFDQFFNLLLNFNPEEIASCGEIVWELEKIIGLSKGVR